MDEVEGGEYRALVLRLLDRIEEDIKALETQQSETEKVARSAFLRVEGAEDHLAALRADMGGNVARLREELEKVSNESRTSTISLAEIKATAKAAAKGAGYVAGAVTGALGAIITAFLMKILHLN